jgi:hypothetical protein
MNGVILALRLILAGLLYAFLGLTLYVLWRELRVHATPDSHPGPSPAVLYATADDGAARRTPLETVTTIGRAGDNTVSLDDPYASAHHALLLWREGQWWIEDLDSHNGTLVNGERITQATRLTPGDTLLIGETEFHFERA